MLNKDNYVPWSSRLIRYAKSKPNRKLLVNSIKNGSYVRRIIHEPGDPNGVPPVAESTHEQTNDELTEKEMMKGSSIKVQEKKAKNQVGQNAVHNLNIQNVRNRNGLIVVSRIVNQNANQNGNGNVVAARAEGHAEEFDQMATVRDIDEIKEVNSNCILMANLQQALTSGLDNTAKTRRPQPRSNTKNDRVPSASKSSCIKNKEVKQCLITFNHDVCVINYENDMNSHADNQNANVSNAANQKKHKPKVRKTKNVGSKERFASPKPRKPRTCLRWSPTGRLFDLKGKLIVSSKSKCQSDSSICDNASTSNPKEPTSKRVYNHRTRKIIDTMNVTFDELLAIAFEQRSSKLRLQGMTSGQINSGLNLTYASSTITSQKSTERELDLLFEAMYDDYIDGQTSTASRTTPAAPAP
nr:hypothetical protein [Tanacetum cinerariifolium]